MIYVPSFDTHQIVDSIAQVASPAISLMNLRKHIGACYGKSLSEHAKNLQYSSILVNEYLVPKTYHFTKFFELCAKYYDPGSTTILTSNEKYELFSITNKSISTILETSLGSKVLYMEEGKEIYLILNPNWRRHKLSNLYTRKSIFWIHLHL
jgi:hypothetical protein